MLGIRLSSLLAQYCERLGFIASVQQAGNVGSMMVQT
jgi:hypothetical protein